MADIHHRFPIRASAEEVYRAMSTPAGLNQWWTLHCKGVPEAGAVYHLDFGPGYHWHAVVTRAVPGKEFELELTETDADWQGSRVGFKLEVEDKWTSVEFWHTGWPERNSHFRTSSYCWAMYLRILKRYLEFGETVEYAQRLEV